MRPQTNQLRRTCELYRKLDTRTCRRTSVRLYLSHEPNKSVRRVGRCSGLNVNDETASSAPVRFLTSCDVCDDVAPLISSSFCAVHGIFRDLAPCPVTKLTFLSFDPEFRLVLGFLLPHP